MTRAMVAFVSIVAFGFVGFVVTALPASAEPTIVINAPAGTFRLGKHAPVVVTVTADRLARGVLVITTAGPSANANLNEPGGFNGRNAPFPDGSSMVSPSPAGPVRVEQNIDVAAGSTKDFSFSVPVEIDQRDLFASNSAPTIFVRAELKEGGRSIAVARRELTQRDAWQETAGVFPSLVTPALPKQAKLRFNTGDVMLIAVTPTVVAAGAGSLDPFLTVILTPADFDALDATARSIVLNWVNQGGHLLIDADVGPTSLPASWQPSVDGRPDWVVAGAGDIRLTHGRATAGQWDDVFDSTREGYGWRPDFSSNTAFPAMPVVTNLGVDAGFHLPDLGALLLLLGLYVIVIGPVVFFVTAKAGRRTLVWAVVPLVGLIATAGFSVAGIRLRSTAEAAHATLIEVGPGFAEAHSSVLVGSVTGGKTGVEMPKGWVPESPELGADAAVSRPVGGPSGDGSGGGTSATGATGSSPTGGPSTNLDLAPGEFGLVRAAGPVVDRYGGALRVDAHIEDGKVAGTVHSDLDVDLRAAVVSIGAQSETIGVIPAHGSASFRFAMNFGGNNNFNGQRPTYPEALLWPALKAALPDTNRCGFGGPCDVGFGGPFDCDNTGCHQRAINAPPVTQAPPGSELVNAPVWGDAVRRDSAVVRNPGVLTVVGWTDALDAPVTLAGGLPIHRGRTAVLTRGSISLSPGASVAARVEQTRSTDIRLKGIQPDELKVNGALVRVLVPTGAAGEAADVSHLVVHFPAYVSRVSILIDGSWVAFERSPLSHESLEVPLGAGAVQTGVVFVRGEFNFLDGTGSTQQFLGRADGPPTIDIHFANDRDLVKVQETLAQAKVDIENFSKLASLSPSAPILDSSSSELIPSGLVVVTPPNCVAVNGLTSCATVSTIAGVR